MSPLKRKTPQMSVFVAYASPSSIIVSNYTHAWIKKTPLIPKRRLSFWIWSKISCCFFAVGPNPLNAPSRRRWSEFNPEQEVTILWQKHQSLQLICADWVQPSLPHSLPPALPALLPQRPRAPFPKNPIVPGHTAAVGVTGHKRIRGDENVTQRIAYQ